MFHRVNSIPYSGGSSKFLISFVHLSFRSFKFSRLYHFKASSYHYKASPGVFNFSFFLSSFYYRSSSWRLYMMVHQGFNSFSKCSLRFFSQELKYSSSCNPECNCSPLSFEVVIYHSSFTRMRYLNPSIPSLELSWVIFHLKLPLRIVAIYGVYKWSKFFIYPLGEISFSSACSYQSNLLFL